MNPKDIIEAVDKSIAIVCDKFHSNPSLFFTENDIVCYFYSILQQTLPVTTTKDKNGQENFLVHGEYPTPFPCDMSNKQFAVKAYGERTPNGGAYKRGHYDIVVLNPEFIKQHPYDVVKAQTYSLYKQHVLKNIKDATYKPIVLYGLEFMYSRNPIKHSKGDSKEKGVDVYIAEILQDADKLVASKKLDGFMGKIKMLSFIKGSSKEICSSMSEKLKERSEIILCCADYI